MFIASGSCGRVFLCKSMYLLLFLSTKKGGNANFFNAAWSALDNNNSGLSFGQFKKHAQSLVCSKFRLWLSYNWRELSLVCILGILTFFELSQVHVVYNSDISKSASKIKASGYSQCNIKLQLLKI